jgi:hypothetical protein
MKAKTYLVATGMVAILTMIIGTGEALAGPEIRVAEPRHEFAPVPEGVEVTHDFAIRNGGTSDLQITGVETG